MSLESFELEFQFWLRMNISKQKTREQIEITN
jgi:hypothetical protein